MQHFICKINKGTTHENKKLGVDHFKTLWDKRWRHSSMKSTKELTFYDNGVSRFALYNDSIYNITSGSMIYVSPSNLWLFWDFDTNSQISQIYNFGICLHSTSIWHSDFIFKTFLPSILYRLINDYVVGVQIESLSSLIYLCTIQLEF